MKKTLRVSVFVALVSVAVIAQGQSLQSVYAPSSLKGGTYGVGSVTLSGATTAHVYVQLSSTGPITVNANAGVDAAKSKGTFPISAGAVSVETSASISASLGGVSKTAKLLIEPASSSPVALESVALGRSQIGGGENVGGKVLLSAISDSAVSVSLSSNSSCASVPASVEAGGTASGEFVVKTLGVDAATNVTIRASLGTASVFAQLSVDPAGLYALYAKKEVAAGSGGPLYVYFDGQVGPSGATVDLSSSSPDLSVPESVSFSSGKSNVETSFSTSATAASQDVTITASIGTQTVSTTVHIDALELMGVSAFPGVVVGGSPVVIMSWLSADAPNPSAVVSLSSDTPGVLSLPSSLSISAGNFGGFVSANAASVSQKTIVTISATFAGVTRKYLLTVLPGGPADVIK